VTYATYANESDAMTAIDQGEIYAAGIPASGRPPAPSSTRQTPMTIRLDRRASSPVLRQADLPTETTIPWWGNFNLRYECA
jgi:hypothetical protein